jgi:hypothetical protein
MLVIQNGFARLIPKGLTPHGSVGASDHHQEKLIAPFLLNALAARICQAYIHSLCTMHTGSQGLFYYSWGRQEVCCCQTLRSRQVQAQHIVKQFAYCMLPFVQRA